MVVIIRHKYATAHSKAAYLRQIGVLDGGEEKRNTDRTDEKTPETPVNTAVYGDLVECG